MEKRLWTREEEIIVFNLYCKIPFQRSSKSHPDVIKTAKIIGRSPSAVILECKNIEQACSGIGFYNSLIIQHQI